MFFNEHINIYLNTIINIYILHIIIICYESGKNHGKYFFLNDTHKIKYKLCYL